MFRHGALPPERVTGATVGPVWKLRGPMGMAKGARFVLQRGRTGSAGRHACGLLYTLRALRCECHAATARAASQSLA
ncbi:unnamed protein product [Lampetra planeri]